MSVKLFFKSPAKAYSWIDQLMFCFDACPQYPDKQAPGSVQLKITNEKRQAILWSSQEEFELMLCGYFKNEAHLKKFVEHVRAYRGSEFRKKEAQK